MRVHGTNTYLCWRRSKVDSLRDLVSFNMSYYLQQMKTIAAESRELWVFIAYSCSKRTLLVGLSVLRR